MKLNLFLAAVIMVVFVDASCSDAEGQNSANLKYTHGTIEVSNTKNFEWNVRVFHGGVNRCGYDLNPYQNVSISVKDLAKPKEELIDFTMDVRDFALRRSGECRIRYYSSVVMGEAWVSGAGVPIAECTGNIGVKHVSFYSNRMYIQLKI